MREILQTLWDYIWPFGPLGHRQTEGGLIDNRPISAKEAEENAIKMAKIRQQNEMFNASRNAVLNCTREHEELDGIISEIEELIKANPDDIDLKKKLIDAKLQKFKVNELASQRRNQHLNAGLFGSILR